MAFYVIKFNFCFRSKSGVLNLSTIDILGWMALGGSELSCTL